ncbi:MAG: peptidoglycan editing factor PgeF [Betaproteobacteria bacterium]|nr:peptidoglycan editing factor PgeF [Betaproteobacteria bacterium]
MTDWIVPDWPAPANVRALVTTRAGGVSIGPYESMNLATHVGDDPAAVMENRRRLRAHLPADPAWLNQVHGRRVVDAAGAACGVEADAAFSRQKHAVCVVQTADCLPLLLCDDTGSVVAVAHAGWRGLAGGVIEAAVAAMQVPAQGLLAWLGPAIGPRAFEVGADVREAFLAHAPEAAAAFVVKENGKWLADLYRLAGQRLNAAGVSRVFGGGCCTLSEAERFYSFRRDKATGRMASLIWLE